MRTVLIAVLALCVIFVGCQRGEESPALASADHIRPEWGVVLPLHEQAKLPGYCAGPSPAGLTGQWMPGHGEIDRLERKLSVALGKAFARIILEKGETRPRPSDYYRQYGGFYREGRRVIYVCGLHHRFVAISEKTMEPQAWMRRAMGADDGGIAILRVLYDVSSDEFGPVQFEGPFSGPVRSRWL